MGSGQLERKLALNQALALPAILNEIFDRAHLDAVPLAELVQMGQPGHMAVRGQDLADYGGFLQPGEPCQVDASFGVAGTNQDPSLSCTQAGDVPFASDQVIRSTLLINCHL